MGQISIGPFTCYNTPYGCLAHPALDEYWACPSDQGVSADAVAANKETTIESRERSIVGRRVE